MGSDLRITLIARGFMDVRHLQIRLESRGYQVVTIDSPSAVLGFVYSDPPDIIILVLPTPDEEMLDIIRELKGDSFFSTIPIIGALDEPLAEEFDWNQYPLDDFVNIPIKYSELFSRITLAVERIQRVLDNNSLTKLPGNTSIQRAVERVIGRDKAVCYLDINNFKPYNDVYGFTHGDEVLRMVARVMFNAVKESGGGFAGHIGGDDFVFIVPLDRAETVCQTIIEHFDWVVSDLFDDEAVNSGYYVARNRKGEEERMPLLGISISIVPMDKPGISHYGKVGEVAADLKKIAKKSGKSGYAIDRRKHPES